MKMNRIIKAEISKTICTPLFYISLLLGFIFVLFSASNEIIAYKAFFQDVVSSPPYTHEICIDSFSLYNSWIGAELTTIGNTLFFYLLPLIAIMPYGFSLAQELKSGYVKTYLPVCGRRLYFFSKLIAAFIIGGSIIASSLILSLLTISLFVPAFPPKVINNVFYPIRHGDFMAQLSYTHPLTFIFVYIGIDFVFAGLFSCFPLVLSLFCKGGLSSVLLSYLIILSFDLIRSFLLYISYIEISPLKLMHAIPPLNASKWYVIVSWLVILAGLISLLTYAKGRKYEIY